MTTRYVHAIWCDDIRMEIGFKPSFMGVYTAGISFPSLPVIMPKLCVFIWISTPLENPFKKLSISISRDDGLILATFDPEIEGNSSEDFADVAKHIYMTVINLANIEFLPETKYLQVIVNTEDEAICSDKFRVNVSQESYKEESA